MGGSTTPAFTITHGGADGAFPGTMAGGGGAGSWDSPVTSAGGCYGGGRGSRQACNPSADVFAVQGKAVSGGGGGGSGGPGPAGTSGTGGSGVVIVKEKGAVCKVSGVWSMQEQYDKALTGCWSFASPFGEVNILTIGGGAGGAADRGGAGGAGGYQFNTALTIGSANTYTAIVGAGGAGGCCPGTVPGTSGSTTEFSGPDIQSLSSSGGGYGSGSPSCGSPGGSGGGGRQNDTPGCGNDPAKFMSQGNPGGVGSGPSPATGGSGGGAGAAGCGVNGGAGASVWPGDSTLRAGGGGGGGDGSPTAGTAGPGGGGAGGCNTCGASGTANTGGGGGGGGNAACGKAGGAGGSGVVIIQYPGAQAASGGTVTPVPGCKTQHLFSSSDLFYTGYPATAVSFDFLVVGGGGGGGCGGGANAAGGGGAGGYRTSHPGGTKINLYEGSSYAVTVGAGGAAPLGAPLRVGYSGTDSSITVITSTGGGGGGGGTSGAPSPRPSPWCGQPGGSGGGASGSVPTCRTEGIGIPGQGYPGGGEGVPGDIGGSGGGGGAAAGGDGTTPGGPGGVGGLGGSSAILGSIPTAGCYGTPGPAPGRYFAGGGGGGALNTAVNGGAGGAGGGGLGAAGPYPAPGGAPSVAGSAATVNTGGGGGGGGGSGGQIGYAGGPGIAILRLATADKPASFAVAPGTNTTAVCGSCTVAIYTVTGTLTL